VVSKSSAELVHVCFSLEALPQFALQIRALTNFLMDINKISKKRLNIPQNGLVEMCKLFAVNNLLLHALNYLTSVS
jgi:hypothetical protein